MPNGYNVIRRKIICYRLPQELEKVVRQHIQDGRTLASLAIEYGVSKATVSNLVCAYREECQNNDATLSELQLTEELGASTTREGRT